VNKMRESTIMKIHYGTALATVPLMAVHILMRFYKFVPYAIMLELILILISIHGFNGLRVILLELKQGRIYEKAVSYGCLTAMIGLIAYGSRTIIVTNMGMI